jgi:proline iminopeptidase
MPTMKKLRALAVAMPLVLGVPAAATAEGGSGPAVTGESSEGEVRVPGAVLHYAVLGEGEPLLLLAGGPGMPPDYMQPMAAGLGTKYQCVLLDQRGTGRSRQESLDATTVNLDTYVNDVEALRAHLRLDEWVVLGHSWGGMLAMTYAARHPTRVRALVLAGSGGPTLRFMDHFFDNQVARLTLEERELFKYWSDPARSAVDPQRALYERFRAAAPGYVFDRKIALLMAAATPAHAFSAQVYDLMMADLKARSYDLRPALEALSCPVLIIQGRQDPLGDSTAHEIRASLKQASLQFIEKCGHFPWIEQPQAFFRDVGAFLNGLPG